MKTKHIILNLIILLSFCIVIWKTRDGFYVTFAYIVLSILVMGIRRNLLNKLNS